MEIYVNKAGNLVSVEGMKEGVNLTVKISKGDKSETRKMCMKELNSILYNGSYNLATTDRRTRPFCKFGYDPNNASFVVRTGAEWGYRLTDLNPNVVYMNGETNINCRMADVP